MCWSTREAKRVCDVNVSSIGVFERGWRLPTHQLQNSMTPLLPVLKVGKKMSSPAKQVSVRRLPPLPNQSTLRNVRDTSANDNSHGGICLKGKVSVGLSDMQVKEYLMTHPNIVEDFIMAETSQEQLERWLIRKTQSLQHITGGGGDGVRPSLSKWKFCVHTDKRKMLQQLTKDINQHPKKVRVMHELVKSVAAATHANTHSLYLVDKNQRDIYLYSETKPRSRSLCRQTIEGGGTVAAYVAETGERLFVKDILGDERFPKGIGIEDSTAQSVLCQPIVQADGTIVGIVQLVKTLGNASFEREDEEIVNSYLAWGSIAIHHAEISKQMQKQKDLNSFLLNVVKSIFDEVNTMDVVIEKIMAFAKRLVSADRCALFMLDTRTSELYANLFDEGDEDSSGFKFRNGTEIRFPISKGIAGNVASTGEVLNISEPYRDARFNREVDLKTGYITKSVLCVPVRCRGSIIGVVQMLNSRKGFFSCEDARSFEVFAGYCGLALHYSQMYGQLLKAQQKHQVALEVLAYHWCVPESELQQWRNSVSSCTLSNDFYSFEFDIFQNEDDLTNYVIQMTLDVFKDCDVRLDLDTLIRFVLTVRKGYRRVAYHNWSHAFSVAHTMAVIMKSAADVFTWEEKIGLYLSALIHDIDHRGYNNAFMIKNKSPLSHLYSTSTMEWHHFKQGVFILETNGHHILSSLTTQQYRRILELMQDAILATDLMLFFPNRSKLESVIKSHEFDWNTLEHRQLVRRLLMTACDLCGSVKPWPIHIKSVKNVYEEFYLQGDEEKKMGLCPITMMDRAKQRELPQSQVGFLKGIVKPCYSILASVLPVLEYTIPFIDLNVASWERRISRSQVLDTNSLFVAGENEIRESLSFFDY